MESKSWLCPICGLANLFPRIECMHCHNNINISDMSDYLPVYTDQPLSVRKNDGKLRMDLVPVEAEIALAEVLTKGLEKYDEDQWRKGQYYNVPYASLKRHLTAWWSGEDVDPESSLSHLKHVIMNATMLLYYEQNYPNLDNRPKKEKK